MTVALDRGYCRVKIDRKDGFSFEPTCGLMAFRASLSLLILVKIVSGVAAAPGVELDVETELDDDKPTIEIRNPVIAYSFSTN